MKKLADRQAEANGRPSSYSEETIARICTELALGKSLRSICDAPDMPARNTVFQWLEGNKDFQDRYARARMAQADTYADEIVDLADGAKDHNKARLQIDARKWTAAKLRPSRYSERFLNEHTGKDGAPITVRQITADMSPQEAALEYARSLRPTMLETWPPNYVEVFAQRQKRHRKLRSNMLGAKEYYRTRPVEFIEHWVSTYDPRVTGGELPSRLPFILFQRQRDLVQFLLACLEGETNGLIEKCRDVGATWVCCAFSVWLWLYWPGVAVGWGSRKEQLVDKLGDPDSIFEKMRMIILGLPREFLPTGFSLKDDLAYMRIINPETGATITGEAGDNIGRGGRKRIYFKDEAAHLERPEKVEAALADNTRVQIDISSVNGLGNVFHRRREAGQEWQLGRPMSKTCSNVFIMDWRDHPGKTQAWYDQRRAKAQSDGLLHVFAQEVDRNYAASVENVVIPADWVRAAIDAHIKLGFGDDGRWVGALDVADGGGDRNALAMRKGSVLKHVEEWGERDTGLTARRAVAACAKAGSIEVQYDCIGVGSGVKAETNRLLDERLMPKSVKFVPWDAGAGPFNPDDNVIKGDRDSPLNKDFYGNLKAQGWWQLRRRFENTYRAATEGVRLNADDLISLSSDLPLLRQLEKELSQPTASKSARMKLIIDKTPDGTRSPNIADAVMMAFWPTARAFVPYTEWL